jgi:hypothetical protein
MDPLLSFIILFLCVCVYFSKLLLTIYLGESSTLMLMASPGKGNTTSKPRQSFNKTFSKEKVGNFLNSFNSLILLFFYITIIIILLSYDVIVISCDHTSFIFDTCEIIVSKVCAPYE